MNIKITLLAVALISSANVAMADTNYPNDQQQHASAPSGKTRAEVKAELAAARADGSLPNYSSYDYPRLNTKQTAGARPQVQSEPAGAAKHANASHEHIEVGS